MSSCEAGAASQGCEGLLDMGPRPEYKYATTKFKIMRLNAFHHEKWVGQDSRAGHVLPCLSPCFLNEAMRMYVGFHRGSSAK